MSQHQSRIFTFIGNRTNQLKNTCAKGLRQIRVAVVWSGQILFYPLHILAQRKIFQPKLSAPPSTPLLPQPAPDITIEEALDLVEVANYPIQVAARAELTINDWSDIEVPSYPIQVAHGAELVIDDWSYIDENLWDTSQGNTSIKSREFTDISRTSTQITPLKPKIRGLSSLLSDRQLVLVTTENELLNVLTITQQQEIRRKIGLDLATSWHEWYLYSLSIKHSPHTLSAADQLLLTGADTIPESAPELSSQNFFDKLRNWFKKPQPPAQVNSIDLTQLIPETSVQVSSQPQLAPAAFPFSPQPPKFQRYLDLPQLPPIIEPNSPTQSTSIVVTIATKLQPDWLRRWWNYYREYISIPDDGETSIVHQPDEFKLTPILPTPSRTSPKQQPQLEQTTSIYFNRKSTQNLEYHPDWIDAEAEEMGYSQSLIARLFAWLDRQIFRLENWIIDIVSRIFDRG